MGMHLSVYVGPYYTVPKDFEWTPWENIVTDGRIEAGTNDEFRVLIPNQPLQGIERHMHVDSYGADQLQRISPSTMIREITAFGRLADSLIKHCDDRGIEIREEWGIVPCWS